MALDRTVEILSNIFKRPIVYQWFFYHNSDFTEITFCPYFNEQVTTTFCTLYHGCHYGMSENLKHYGNQEWNCSQMNNP